MPASFGGGGNNQRPGSPLVWPNASNTGVPPGTTLTTYTGPTNITTPGTVIDSKDIHGPILVNADNVTIKNSRIWLGPGDTASQNVALWFRAANNGSVSHVEVDGALGGQSYTICAIANDQPAGAGSPGSFVYDAVNLHNCGDGIRGGNLTVKNSYIHDFWFGVINGVAIDTPHADCVQGLFGQSNVLAEHNTLWNPNSAPGQTSGYSNSVFQIGTEGNTPVTNWTINNNLMEGGGFAINMNSDIITGVTISNNRFGRDQAYGLLTYGALSQWTWTNNVYDDNGQPALP